MSLEVAVVGVGRWGRNHVRVLSALRKEYIDRLIVVDSDFSRAKEVANAYSADAFYDSVEELFSWEKNLDAVVVVVPTVYHYRVVDSLLDHYDVFVEKPLAETIEQGFSLALKSLSSGRVLAVGHIERFNPIVGIARKLLEQSKKKIYAFEARRLGPGPAGNYTLNLGVAHDLLVHDVDIAAAFLEDLPRTVYASAVPGDGFPYEVEIEALYSYPGARTAHIVASWRTAPSYKHRSFSVRTEDSIITIDYILRRIVIDNGVQRVETPTVSTALHSENTHLEISYLQEEPLKLELKDFLEAVSHKRRPQVSAVEGYIALKCVVKALESAARRSPVEITWDELSRLNYTF
ncbi:MAG: Gfo/Idh/MocA family oxidoreductase [Infirmifilum sp.]